MERNSFLLTLIGPLMMKEALSVIPRLKNSIPLGKAKQKRVTMSLQRVISIMIC